MMGINHYRGTIYCTMPLWNEGFEILDIYFKIVFTISIESFLLV